MFGSSNKDKLRENMEEIKQMVEEGETMDPSESQDEFEPVQEEPDFEEAQNAASEEDMGDFGQELEQEFQAQQEADELQESKELNEQDSTPAQTQQAAPESMEEHPTHEDSTPEPRQSQDRRPEPDTSRTPQQTKQDNRIDQQNDRVDQQNMGTGQTSRPQHRSRQEHEGRRAGRNQNRADTHNTRGLEADIPEPAETREISVPDIDKGPLFIRREKFEQAAHLIQEMRYLSEQMEATVNTIEEDLQRGQNTENQVRELLSGFEEDRASVEKIVSPKDC